MAVAPINAIIIPADGPGETRLVNQDIRELQGIVGGYLEAIYTMHDQHGSPQVTLWCNDDGIRLGLPINRRATALWYTLNEGETGQQLRGTVLVTGGDDGQGDILPVPAEVAAFWASVEPN